MNPPSRPATFVALILACLPKVGAADAPTQLATLFDSRYLHVDLKAIGQEKGDFGIDYKFGVGRNLTRNTDETGSGTNEITRDIHLKVSSEGFVAVTEKENQFNSIVNKLAFEAWPLWMATPDSEKVKNHMDAANGRLDIEEIADEDEAAIRKRFHAEAVACHSPLLIFADAHLEHETTQDFSQYDLAFGARLAFNTSYLNQPLDWLTSALRWGPAAKNNNPRQIDLAFGYDRVINMTHTANRVLRDGRDEANRLVGKVEWETGLFHSQRLVLSYQVHQEIDAPSKVRDAGLDLNQFFMARVDLIQWKISGKLNSAVSVKYMNGELPPNYVRGSVLGGGFSVDF